MFLKFSRLDTQTTFLSIDAEKNYFQSLVCLDVFYLFSDYKEEVFDELSPSLRVLQPSKKTSNAFFWVGTKKKFGFWKVELAYFQSKMKNFPCYSLISILVRCSFFKKSLKGSKANCLNSFKKLFPLTNRNHTNLHFSSLVLLQQGCSLHFFPSYAQEHFPCTNRIYSFRFKQINRVGLQKVVLFFSSK